MRRGLLMVVLLGGVLAGVLWWRRGSSRPDTPEARSVDAGVRHAPRRGIDHAAPADARDRPIIVNPPDAASRDDAALAELTHGLGDAHAHLVELVAPCFDGAKLTDAAVIKFRYVLTIDGGTAHAAEVLVTESTEPIVDQVPCMTEAIGAASWPTQHPDLETPVDDQLTGAELR